MKDNNLSSNINPHDLEEEDEGEEDFLLESNDNNKLQNMPKTLNLNDNKNKNISPTSSEKILQIHNEVNCYIMTDSIVIEGNLNHVSILTNIIKTYDKIFKLNLKYNYSFNTSASNMKIEHLPCIYNNGKIINKNEIFKFFIKTVNYKKSKEISNDIKIKEIEYELLKNMIIEDFQNLINYINYYRNKNFFGNSLRFLIQPYKKLNGIWVDYKEVIAIEKRYNISNKKEAIFLINDINNKVEEYLNENYDINKNIINLNDFLILIYTFYKTQEEFFGAKMKKYGFNKFKFINALIRIIDKGIEKNIYVDHKIFFKPEIFFIDFEENNGKNGIQGKICNSIINNKDKYMKQPVPEENTNFRLTNKLILQGIGYGAFFGFLYYLKNKII